MEGFHALHWNMLSWFGEGIMVLRVFLILSVVRATEWVFSSILGCAVVDLGIFCWCGVVRTCCVVLFGCWLGGSVEGEWEAVWAGGSVGSRLLSFMACEGGSSCGMA